MNCPDCTHAQTDAEWPGLSASCPDCDIRAIAMSPADIRQMYVEQIETACGLPAATEVKRRVREEVSRIRALKGEKT